MNNTTSTQANTVHIFEAAGLGTGPFQLQHTTSEGGNCQYCGTAIVYRFYIEGTDNRQFFVGSDCVMKTGDAGLVRKVEKIVKEHQKALRKANDAAKIAAFRAFLSDPANIAALTAQPHPYAWHAKSGRTMLDYVQYVQRFGGKSAVLKLARKLLPATPKAPKAKRGVTA